MEKLGLELASLQEVPFIIFGDFNFRLNQPKLLECILLPPSTPTKAQCFDEEPGPFEGSLFEYPIQFRPSYPFSEDPSKPSEYASSRFPAWCDRVFISRSALSLLDIRDAIYGLLCEDVSVGDHKPVFLHLTLADDTFTVNQEPANQLVMESEAMAKAT
nr:unnamed protein product [Spirometra erinaceieuropaei]